MDEDQREEIEKSHDAMNLDELLLGVPDREGGARRARPAERTKLQAPPALGMRGAAVRSPPRVWTSSSAFASAAAMASRAWQVMRPNWWSVGCTSR